MKYASVLIAKNVEKFATFAAAISVTSPAVAHKSKSDLMVNVLRLRYYRYYQNRWARLGLKYTRSNKVLDIVIVLTGENLRHLSGHVLVLF